MSFTRTAAETLMKELYLDNDIEAAVVRNHPLLTMLQRESETTFDGRYWYVAAQYANTQGASYTASTAESVEVAPKQVAFTVRPVSLYQYPKIDGAVVRSAMIGKGANHLINAFKSSIDGGLRTMGTRMAKSAYGNAGGSLARVSSTTAPSGNTLTLANAEDTVFFEPGMEIVVSANDGSASGHALRSATSITIVSVNRAAGTISGSAAWSTVSTAVGDSLFAKGDFQAAPSGLAGWCPTTAPSDSDSFNGVNRSVDPTRLGGLRYDGSNESFETVFLKANALAHREGLTFGKIMVNPTSFAGLQIAKEGSRFIDDDNDYGIGIQGFEYNGAKFYVDPDCPVGRAYIIGDGAFKLASLGQVPKIGDQDGNKLRLQTGDVYQVQLVADFNYLSPAPGHLMVVTLPTVS